MSSKSSQTLAEELKRFVAPFRHDGSGKLRLKSYKTNEKGGLDKDEAEAEAYLDALLTRSPDGEAVARGR